jgi:hypothetical protein
MDYHTIEPYQQTAGEEFKQRLKQPFWPAVTAEFLIWEAKENVRRFTEHWFDITVQF